VLNFIGKFSQAQNLVEEALNNNLKIAKLF